MNPSTGNGFDNMNSGGQGGYGVGGDIILSPSGTTEKKNGKKTILIVVVFLMLAVVVTLLLVWLFGFGGIKDLQGNKLKRSFNSYVNYVVLGEDSEADFDVEILNERPYFDKLNYEQIDEYLTNAEEKYKGFEEKCVGYNECEGILASRIYYQDYANINSLVKNLLVSLPELYVSLGGDEVNDLVNDKFDVEVNDYDLARYIEAAKKMISARFEMTKISSDTGCLENTLQANGCQNVLDDEQKKYYNAMLDASELENRIKETAKNMLGLIYLRLDNSEEGGS